MIKELVEQKADSDQQLKVNQNEKEALELEIKKMKNEKEREALFLTDFYQSDLYQTLSKAHYLPNYRISDSEKEELIKNVNYIFPNFKRRLIGMYSNIKPDMLFMCYMIKIGLPLMEIASHLCVSPSGLTKKRERLYKSIFKKEGSAKELDDIILSL